MADPQPVANVQFVLLQCSESAKRRIEHPSLGFENDSCLSPFDSRDHPRRDSRRRQDYTQDIGDMLITDFTETIVRADHQGW